MITSLESRRTFTASGSSGTFVFPFPVFDEFGLGVVALNVDGEEFTPTYTVALASDRSGATVSIASGLTAGDKVVVYRTAIRKQAQPLGTSGPLPLPTIERALDRLTADMQAVILLLERAIGASMTDDAVLGNIPDAVARASKVLGFDNLGRPTVLSNVPLDPAVAVSGFMQDLLLNGTAAAALADLGVASYMIAALGDADATALQTRLGLSAYFRSLLGAADAPALRSLLEVANLASAFIDNGSCQVCQDPTGVSLTTSPQHSPVDRFSVWASGGTVGAGTSNWVTASLIARAGYSLKFAGTTLTGSGQLSVRYRLDTFASRRLRVATVSFAVLVAHDVGAAVNCIVVFRKPTAPDDFTTTTLIATSSATAVSSGLSSGTRVEFENVAIGDVTNGFEIELQIACGAVTTKNFEVTEFVLAEASTAPAFQSLNTYAANLAACQRFLRRKIGAREIYSGDVTSGADYRHAVRFDAPMRAIPAVTLSDIGVNAGFPATAPTADAIGTDGFDAVKQSNSTQNGGYFTYRWVADARLAP